MSNQREVIAAYRNRMNSNLNNFSGNQLANAPGQMPSRPAGWSAAGGANAFAVAPQYILQISNSTNVAVSNFDVFGASIYLSGAFGGATWSTGGSLTYQGVTISSVFSNISYQQILTSSAYKPFTSGGVYLQSISGSTAQVSDPYTITSQTAGGEKYQSIVAPIIDANQFQSGITYNNTSFNIEPLTKLTWNTIYASAVFQIRIFPANIIDASNALSGGNVQQAFTKPRVIGSLR